MKKLIIVFSVLIFLFERRASAQTQDSTLTALLAIPETSFINKPLDSIIARLPTNYVSMKVVGTRNTARSLMIRYPNKVWIELHVRQFSHMNPEDMSRTWNISLMRQENLYKSRIQQKSTCYRNCDILR
jgi:hypothetical protein